MFEMQHFGMRNWMNEIGIVSTMQLLDCLLCLHARHSGINRRHVEATVRGGCSTWQWRFGPAAVRSGYGGLRRWRYTAAAVHCGCNMRRRQFARLRLAVAANICKLICYPANLSIKYCLLTAH